MPPPPDDFPPPPAPPVAIPLTVLGPAPCPYLPGRTMTTRAFSIARLPAGVYRAFMDANFRRSGTMVYQPVCDGCRECRQLRVIVDAFTPSSSQRRCGRKNADLLVTFARPCFDSEKAGLYARYLHQWHGRPEADSADEAASDLERFLYDSPTDTLEFEYHDPADGRLLAVGICDVSSASLSSVYFYYDPAQAARGLGTFGVLHEIAFARQHGLAHYYLGYWVKDCRQMAYKANFYPHDVLRADGAWERRGGREEA